MAAPTPTAPAPAGHLIEIAPGVARPCYGCAQCGVRPARGPEFVPTVPGFARIPQIEEDPSWA